VQLKHLDFLHIAAVQAILCFANLYELAKEKSGPLKGGVETVEGTVKSIVNPVYKRFRDLPLDLLFLADCKVRTTVPELILAQHFNILVEVGP
jgi:Rubber elongation factor protein (REF)